MFQALWYVYSLIQQNELFGIFVVQSKAAQAVVSGYIL